MTRDGKLKESFILTLCALCIVLITLICQEHKNEPPRDCHGYQIWPSLKDSQGENLKALPAVSPK